MKQWNAISFSAIVFSLIAGHTINAQTIEIQDPVPQYAVPQAALVRRPVVVTPGMAPQVVPQVQRSVPIESGDGARSGIVVDGPQTGVSGDNPGNANTGGVQVQSVTVQANPEAKAVNDSSSGLAMKGSRVREERYNEDRVLERLEYGRLQDERARLNSIESLQGSVQGDRSGTAQSSASSNQTATAIGNNPKATTINIQTPAAANDHSVIDQAGIVGVSAIDDRGDIGIGRTFKISPFVGYRWYQDTNPYFDVSNNYVTGIGGEAVISKYFSIESMFTYARDEMKETGGGGSGYNYGGYNYGYNNQYYYNAFTRTRDSYEVGAGVKVGNNFSFVRPYISAGLGFRYNQYNIDNQYTTEQAELVGWQRATNRFLGNLGAGADFSVARYVSLGARFDYQAVLNKNNDYMDVFYNDSSNSYQAAAQLQIVF